MEGLIFRFGLGFFSYSLTSVVEQCEFCLISDIVQSLFLEVFKIELDKPMSNLVWPNGFEKEVEQATPEALSKPDLSCDLMILNSPVMPKGKQRNKTP